MWARLSRYETFFERRRARRRRGDAKRPYSFELAALHLELLVAMASVDGSVDPDERSAVLAFIDRMSLTHDDRARLRDLAVRAFAQPPVLQVLASKLSSLAGQPAIARRVAEDLAQVAAADGYADPREVTLLEFVCNALGVPVVPIRIAPKPADDGASSPGRAAPNREAALARAERVAASRKVRSAVRDALEASYASRDTPFG